VGGHNTALARLMMAMIPEVPHDHPVLVQFREDPYPLYRYLLAAAPVQWNDVLGAWTLARYADVVASLTDARFSADRTERGRADALEGYELAKSMLVSDPPDHTRMRALVQKAFTPRMIEQLRPRIVSIVGELLDRIADRGGTFDVIADLAYPLPVVVIAELLGVPPEDREVFEEWSALLAASLDPLVSADLMGRVTHARDALHTYLRGIIALRRREPKADLISALVAVEERGDVLSEPELVVMCTLLLIAGHETTVNLIGNGMLALLQHPDQLAQLRESPQLIGTAVEELLRFDSPVQMTGRVVLEPLELGGKAISAGEFVLPLLGAANRDPAQFPEPDKIDVARTPNAHVAFGRGIHFCLGAPLARAEGQIAIGALVRRFRNIEQAGQPVRRDQITLRGLKSLPLTS
jgi:pimeloyl-[acyl-carrier protein] synthase